MTPNVSGCVCRPTAPSWMHPRSQSGGCFTVSRCRSASIRPPQTEPAVGQPNRDGLLLMLQSGWVLAHRSWASGKSHSGGGPSALPRWWPLDHFQYHLPERFLSGLDPSYLPVRRGGFLSIIVDRGVIGGVDGGCRHPLEIKSIHHPL